MHIARSTSFSGEVEEDEEDEDEEADSEDETRRREIPPSLSPRFFEKEEKRDGGALSANVDAGEVMASLCVINCAFFFVVFLEGVCTIL